MTASGDRPADGGKPAPIPLRDKLAVCLILAAIFGVFGYAAILSLGPVAGSNGAVGPPALYAGLPVDAGEANASFRARILSRFPLLTREDELVRTLSDQGFISDGWFGKRMTFRRLPGGYRGCDFTASVVWESDDRGRISALDARFLRTPDCTAGPL